MVRGRKKERIVLETDIMEVEEGTRGDRRR